MPESQDGKIESLKLLEWELPPDTKDSDGNDLFIRDGTNVIIPYFLWQSIGDYIITTEANIDVLEQVLYE